VPRQVPGLRGRAWPHPLDPLVTTDVVQLAVGHAEHVAAVVGHCHNLLRIVFVHAIKIGLEYRFDVLVIVVHATLHPDLVGKQLEILKNVRPTVARVAVLWNPAHPVHPLIARAAEVASPALGVQLHRVEARGADAFDRAFAAMTSAHAGALLFVGDPLFTQHHRRLTELAATSRLPTMYTIQCPAFVEAGGLLCYGPSLLDMWRRAATYVDKILQGAKPGDLPVEQPMKFELVINLKTAEALGLTIPPTLLFQATEVLR